uniref:Uncharacterized protein n=1 Tax=Hemiselmis tepida TaxID=464990 RepID=A0A7S0YX64_9CRYP
MHALCALMDPGAPQAAGGAEPLPQGGGLGEEDVEGAMLDVKRGDRAGATARPRRHPAPNYRAEFVSSHNPDLADRFDLGFYRLDLERAVNDLRAELAKL